MSEYGIQIKGTSPILKRPVRPLSSQSPHLSVYKEGGEVGKKRKAPQSPTPTRPKSVGKLQPPGPKSGGKPQPLGPKSGGRKKFGGPPKEEKKPKVAEDWAAEGGRIGFKKGGDSRWIQKATKSIKERGTEGKCTPITKPGCTGRAKALAKTFKKMAKKRKNA